MSAIPTYVFSRSGSDSLGPRRVPTPPPPPLITAAPSDRTVFLTAARTGSDAKVRDLLSGSGIRSLTLSTSDVTDALREASAAGHDSTVRILLGAGASVNHDPKKIWCDEDREYLEELSKERIPQRPITRLCGEIGCGKTALTAAAEGGYSRVVAALLEAGANVDAPVGRWGDRTALQAAAGAGHVEVVHSLLEHGANANSKPSDEGGRTALQAAAENGHFFIVTNLLSKKADINALPSHWDGRTALQAAAERGHAALVSQLLLGTAEINAKPCCWNGRTALQAAAEGGHTAIVSALLAAGADINAPPSEREGRTALQAAAGKGHESVVSTLLEKQADVDARPSYYNGRTALQAAAGGGHGRVVKTLLGAGAAVNAPPSEESGRTALQAAAENGQAEIVAVLLKHQANVNALPSKVRGVTALQAAAGKGHVRIVTALLNAGAEVNAPPSRESGRTALQAAAEGGHEDIVRILLSKKASVNAPACERKGRTALQAAAGKGHAAIVVTLLKAKANINAPPSAEDGRTPLLAAVEGAHVETVSTLLNAGVNFTTPIEKFELLREAAKRGNAEVMGLLVAKGAHQDLPDQGLWQTTPDFLPLSIAATRGHADVVRVLLEAGARRDAGAPDHTAMRAATENGRVEVVRVFLEMGADMNAQDTQGRTCITWGISHPKVVEMLVENGANIDMQDFDGKTPLHHAVQGYHEQSLVILINAGANSEVEDYDNQRPLDIMFGGKKRTVSLSQLLLKNGCSPQRCRVDSWRTLLKANTKDIFVMTETIAQPPSTASQITADPGQNVVPVPGTESPRTQRERPIIDISLAEKLPKLGPPAFANTQPPNFSQPNVRRLYYVDNQQDLFPREREIERYGACIKVAVPDNTTVAMIQWSWIIITPIDPENTTKDFKSGNTLPNIGKLIKTSEKEALLTCCVCFQFFTAKSEEENPSNQSGRAFKVVPEMSKISWTMRNPYTGPPTSPADAKSTPLFRTVEFSSTLDIGWIPEHGVEFFRLFVLDLHKKWRVLFEQAETHLATNRKILLLKKGRTVNFIDNLLLDAQQWSNFRALLQIHVRKTRDLVRDFKEKRYLCDEIGEPKNQREAVITSLESIIEKMELEVEAEIKKLDVKTKDMIELEFNLVSIYEARTSKIMGMSMKRLSWITFIFLPLMFVASLMGMNIDIINDGVPWWWVAVLGLILTTIVVAVWVVLKLVRFEEWDESEDGTSIGGRVSNVWKNLNRGWRTTVQRTRSARDLESGQNRAAPFEFKAPPRQWTKLKDH